MKISCGFVSNSSTCSFVIIGWRLKNIDLEKIKDIFGVEVEYDEEDPYLLEEKLFFSGQYPLYWKDDSHFLGIEIASWSDGWLENVKKSLTAIEKELMKLKSKAEELGLDPENSRLFAGSYGC